MKLRAKRNTHSESFVHNNATYLPSRWIDLKLLWVLNLRCSKKQNRVMRIYIALCEDLKPFAKTRNATPRYANSRCARKPCIKVSGKMYYFIIGKSFYKNYHWKTSIAKGCKNLVITKWNGGQNHYKVLITWFGIMVR